MKKVKIIVDNREFEVDIPKDLVQRLMPDYDVIGYELIDNHNMWFDRCDGATRIAHHSMIESLYDAGNLYSSKRVAENNIRADRLMRLLRRFSALHRENKLDWTDRYNKWCICYDYTSDKLTSCAWDHMRTVNTVYFDSLLATEAAIAQYEDELIWYFTEYCDTL